MDAKRTTEQNGRGPFLLVQLSDPHIGADWAGPDPKAALNEAVAAVRRLPSHPDAVLITGDLADHAADDEYAVAHEALDGLGAPLYVLPGNHDDPERLRAHFDCAADGAADLGPLRLVLLDSTRPGDDAGELTPDQLAWLDEELAAAPGQPTLLALHHPPFATGIPAADAVGLAQASVRALADVLARHPQVTRIVAGHVHRPITAELAGRPVVTAPSTFAQVKLDFEDPELRLASEPAGFAVHALVGGAIVSHVQPVV